MRDETQGWNTRQGAAEMSLGDLLKYQKAGKLGKGVFFLYGNERNRKTRGDRPP